MADRRKKQVIAIATLALGAAGAAVGSVFGATQIGFSAGTLLAGVLFPPNAHGQGGHPLADVRVTGSGYGSTIPIIYGRFRIGGNIIDATDLVPVVPSGKGGAPGGSKVHYNASAAVAVCRGPITSIDRIWAEDRLLYDVSQTPSSLMGDTIRIYLGDEAQMPDSLFLGIHGTGNVPAYRGLAYVVFDTLNCARWGNRLPSFNFEVVSIVPYHTLIDNTANLKLYYRFDTSPGQLLDTGPKGDNLTLSGGTINTVSGHANQGVSFNAGVPLLIATVGNDADFGSSAITVEGWFQYKGGAPVNGSSQFHFENPNDGMIGWEIGVSPDLLNPNTFLQFRHRDPTNGLVTTFNTSVARDTAWHYMAVTYDTLGIATLYYDGKAVATATPPTPLTFTSSAQNRITVLLNDYGFDELAFYNRILSAAEVYVHFQSKGTTVGTILSDVFNQVGLSPNQVDVTGAVDVVEGFLIHTRQDARTAIQELLRLYDTDLAEYDGVLHAVKRGGSPVLTVAVADTGAHVTTGAEVDPPRKIETKRLPELEVPFRVDLRYYDRTLNYQLGLQGANRYTKTEIQEPLTIHSTLVFHRDIARQKAEKELYRQWVERQQHVFSVGPSYLQLAASDVVNLPIGATTVRARIIAIDMGLLGPLTMTAVADDATLLSQSALGQVLTSSVEVVTAQTTTLIAWDGNALRDGDASVVGLYVAAASPAGQEWPGAALYLSRDGGSSYQPLDTLSQTATYGTANTALPNWTGGDVWDTIDTVDINLVSGTAPASTSDADVLSGNNAALLGNEIIQFATVTPQGGSVYRLSRLLRARRGTDQHQPEHQVGEQFLLLGSQNVLRENLGNDLAGRQVFLKAVTGNASLASTTAVPVYLGGYELWPYSPVQIAATRDGSNNATITWVRRARTNQEMRDGADIPVGETTEAYEVRIRSGSPKTISGMTLAAMGSAQLTITAHGFSVNDNLLITGVQGATDINGRIVVVQAVPDANHVTIDLDTSAYQPYISSGTAEKTVRTISVSAASASYTAAQATADGLPPAGPVGVAVFQVGQLGRGYAGLASV